jgi:acyl-coenzyme A thioesterase PaaI-like protein
VTPGIALEQRTHTRINARLCGEPIELAPGWAQVALALTPEMAADDRGLVHGGFVFGLADYAAMLAINHPNVVLGACEMRFLKPVRVSDTLVAWARLDAEQGKKRFVKVDVRRGEEVVATATCTCFVPDRHVLDPAPSS